MRGNDGTAKVEFCTSLRESGNLTEMFDRFRHGKLRELLSSYIDGEVSDSERRRVERHLSGCEECRRELESLRLTVAALRQMPEIQATRSFAISAPPEPVRGGLGWVLGVRLAASAAAVVLVGLILADVTGLVVQSDMPDWGRESYSEQAPAPAPAFAAPAPAPAAPAPDAGPSAHSPGAARDSGPASTGSGGGDARGGSGSSYGRPGSSADGCARTCANGGGPSSSADGSSHSGAGGRRSGGVEVR